TRRRGRSRRAGARTYLRSEIDSSLLTRLAEEPDRAAILLDVDGTLAPIVERPEDARLPDDLKAELARLVGRYALVACISGWPGGRRWPGSGRVGAGRCWRSARRWTSTRAPRSSACSAKRGCAARSTRSTTRLTWKRSAASTGSRSRCGSRLLPMKDRANSGE